jgi:hypothetical protein
MKYLFCLVFLLAQAPFFLHGQSNYKPGYVINTKNDTIKGFVDYREWIKNPKEFAFKQTLNAPAEKFSVANANGFAIAGTEYYDRAIVKVSTSKIELSQLSHALDTAYTTDTVFLKNLVDGKNISLYVFTNSLKSNYYIQDRHTGIMADLKYYVYYDEEHLSMANVNSYRRQLSNLSHIYQPDDVKLQKNILKAAYSETDLSNIVIRLNGGNSTQQLVNISSGVRFFAGAGIRSNKLIFKSANGAGPFSDGVSDNTLAPAIGGGLDILLNKHTEKLVVRMEVALSMNNFKFSETKGSNSATYLLNFKQFAASFTPQIMYSFYSTDKLKIFVDAGLAMNVYAYNKYNYITTYSYGVSNSQSKYPEFQSFEFSIPIKAGVQINKHLEIYGSYWLPASITRYLYYSADLSAFQAGINYLFK